MVAATRVKRAGCRLTWPSIWCTDRSIVFVRGEGTSAANSVSTSVRSTSARGTPLRRRSGAPRSARRWACVARPHGVVRRAEGAVDGDAARVEQQARDRADGDDLERLLLAERLEDAGEAAREHRLAGAGRADEQQVVVLRDPTRAPHTDCEGVESLTFGPSGCVYRQNRPSGETDTTSERPRNDEIARSGKSADNPFSAGHTVTTCPPNCRISSYLPSSMTTCSANITVTRQSYRVRFGTEKTTTLSPAASFGTFAAAIRIRYAG